ncbi:hypothetical protein ACJIZ3_010566 [Penstemon smallii]|uniref:Uncharacterized protein n=1 Tax=Penstemon smallii TaxID=265156 RepID=A0ABD3UGN6_9LAMI
MFRWQKVLEFLKVGFFYHVRELSAVEYFSFHECDSVVIAINRGVTFNYYLTC